MLLTSTALVAFAGAAAAEAHTDAPVVFTGSATLGYNDIGDLAPVADSDDGFYWDAELGVLLSAALNGGLTASAEFNIEVANGGTGVDLESGDFVLKLASDTASLAVGDLDPVAEDRWDGVDGSTVADFNDQDVHFSEAVGFEAMLVGEATIAGFTAAVSYGLDSDGETIENALDAMQLHVAGEFGNFGVQVAYQEEFAGADAIFGVSGSTAFAGADVQVSYIDDGTENSLGLGASYPVGPVTVGGYYSINDVAENNYGLSADYLSGPIAVSAAYDVDAGEGGADDVGEYEIDASYDVGNGLMVFGGLVGDDVDGNDMGYYAAATYDLGSGAELLFSYADDGDDTNYDDEFGGPEYMEGTTVEVSFSF